MSEADSFYYNEAIRKFEEAYQAQEDKDLDKAISLYTDSLELYPTAEAFTYLGWVHSLKGDLKSAIRNCREAIKVDPDYGNPYNDIGAYLIEAGEPDKAMAWLAKALQAKRYDSYYYPYYNMGRVWEQKGEWKQALRAYQDAIREKRDYALAQKAINRLLALFN